MSPRDCSCTLCGWVIVDHLQGNNVSWLSQFRGVISGPDGVFLSGVGLYDRPDRAQYIAPTDRRRRWDDPDYHSPDSDEFGAMDQQKINRKHGFIFHEACWDFLEKASHPEPVPLTRLFDVCISLPFPQDRCGLSWGHTYGRLMDVDDEHHFPWEYDRFTDRGNATLDPMFGANPYAFQEVQLLLAEAPQQPGGADLVKKEEQSDPLLRLHVDVKIPIAMNLSMSDVLNLRRASSAFWEVYYVQKFWTSRFESSWERSWLFEARGNEVARDWTWLYRRTNHLINPGLRNRVRIWNLAHRILGILDLSWVEVGVTPSPDETEPSAQSEPSEDSEPEEWPHQEGWMQVSGELSEPSPGVAYRFSRGSRLFHKWRVPIPDDLLQLSMSYVRVRDSDYLSGLKLVTAGGQSHQVGYWNTTIEQQYTTQVSEIRGFKLAVGSRGIQALQCIPAGSNVSHWIGKPDGAPKTQHLDLGSRVAEIEIGFDGCKMVSIAVPCQPPSLPSSEREEKGLRNLGMWYPDVPGPSLCLNEDSFWPRDYYLSGYKPLFWTSFGGPGGMYLRHLTELSVTGIRGTGVFHRINFAYDVAVPAEHQTFGCQMPHRWSQITRFAIDGPGGERIVAVQVFDDRMYAFHEGDMAALKMTTNRGRNFCFPEQLPQYRSCRVAVPPGTIITGFYGRKCLHNGYGYATLGVISEEVGGTE